MQWHKRLYVRSVEKNYKLSGMDNTAVYTIIV